jgi:ubiquinone/menaquinone biosynthesis C-methylase UbiE
VDPLFRRDLYKGTADDYDRFRPRYPEALRSDLLARAKLHGGRLLDLACGTGQIAFDFADHFDEVLAVDQEAESVEFAARKANRLAVRNIEFRVGEAESLDVGNVLFDLVAIGNAFHRVRRAEVCRGARRWLRPGGYLALLWGGTPNLRPEEVGQSEAEWQAALVRLMEKWMAIIGEERVPATLERALQAQPHEMVLDKAGFEVRGTWDFLEPYVWSVETLIGFLYSTSVLSRLALGDRAAAFEDDVRNELLAAEPSGVFHQQLSFAYQLARAPG